MYALSVVINIEEIRDFCSWILMMCSHYLMKYRALACEEGILSILIQRNWRRKFVHGY